MMCFRNHYLDAIKDEFNHKAIFSKARSTDIVVPARDLNVQIDRMDASVA